MEVEAFFINNGKLFQGIIEVDRWAKAEDVWSECKEAIDEGDLIFIRIVKLNKWRLLRNIDYESYSYMKWSGGVSVFQEFKEIDGLYGRKMAIKLLDDMIESNMKKFDNFLKELKIK